MARIAMYAGPVCEQRPLKQIAAANFLLQPFFAVLAVFSIDLLSVCLSILGSFVIRMNLGKLIPGLFQEPLLIPASFGNLWWFPLVVFFFMAYENLYQKRMPAWAEVEKILRAATFAVLTAISLMYLLKLSFDISRSMVILTWLILIITLPLLRYLGKLVLSGSKMWRKPVIVIGSGKPVKLLMKALTREKVMGYEVIGILEDEAVDYVIEPHSGRAVPVLGRVEDAERVVRELGVQDVFVAVHGAAPRQLVNLTNQLQLLVENVILVPDLVGLPMNGIEAHYFFEEQALALTIKNKLNSFANQIVKRFFDFITGTAAIFLAVPIMAVIALAIKIDSPGPVFYTQERLGRRGRLFKLIKYRTMFTEADSLLDRFLSGSDQAREEWLEYQKLRGHDPRLTRIGKILRRFSLDELPQLFNVVAGQMSLIGPRPYLPREKGQMGRQIENIQIARPGLTGLWQVSGRNGIAFAGRLKLDEWYIRNWSLWLDITLLLRTFRVVLKREGAY